MIAIETDRVFSMSSDLKLKKINKNVHGAVIVQILSLGLIEKTAITHLNLATFFGCHFSGFWIVKDSTVVLFLNKNI